MHREIRNMTTVRELIADYHAACAADDDDRASAIYTDIVTARPSDPGDLAEQLRFCGSAWNVDPLSGGIGVQN
jgi:hypothetical protein